MVETDWREILSFSQKELMQADKEKLCESLSWMEADDIELNYTDLKSLFRLAQDILKYKSEQVNNLMGQLETSQRKSGKKKVKSRAPESPSKNVESNAEVIARQEELLTANKEILEQLYNDIAELEGKKTKLEEDRNYLDRDSESSRDPLSEMNEVKQLENEITMKNRHIRKLLVDIKSLEEDNTKLKEKISVLKDKLNEATQLIENLTDQMLTTNNECFQIKDALGKSEKYKAKLTIEIETLKKELEEKSQSKDSFHEEIKTKAQHWKNLARLKKREAEVLSSKNVQLKEQLENIMQTMKNSPTENVAEHEKLKELQEKLSDASNEILESVHLIEVLTAENRQLKSTIEDTHDALSVSDVKNESDDGKERAIIRKLSKRVKILTMNLKGAEEMIANREKELTEITSQLQIIKSDEGLSALLDGIKNKKRKLRIKDEGIKSLVQEVNTLNQLINELQLENEVMRQKLNISVDEKIPTQGIMKNYRRLEQNNIDLISEMRKFENKLVSVELNNRDNKKYILKLTNFLTDLGYSKEAIKKIIENGDDYHNMPLDGSGDAPISKNHKNVLQDKLCEDENSRALIEENEGLRKGLQEILQFLKDNSTTSSGLLALHCPSLEAVLNSLDARHSAGWYAPHMSALMEAKSASGGQDALLAALHEARKETYDALTQLTKESQKTEELEKKLHDATMKFKTTESINYDVNFGEFGTWISEEEQINVNLSDTNEIQEIIDKGNALHEKTLKQSLNFFHIKLKELYERINILSIQATDDQSNYIIKEEQYKAEIESLKSQIEVNEEIDMSDDSPGLVTFVNPAVLQRKCSYLEESYKYIRTLNENMKTEYIEAKREGMILKTEYENIIQKLILSISKLTDKLRHTISIDLFWKQNEILNETAIKYRKIIDRGTNDHNDSIELQNLLENERFKIINYLESSRINSQSTGSSGDIKSMMSNVESSVLQKQLELTCKELVDKKREINNLETVIMNLQETQNKLIDNTLSSRSKEEIDLMSTQLKKLAEDNQILKQQCQHVGNQLDIALLQLQDAQQRKMSNDIEINMLRHQILDLQSTGDNKAIVARLSGEVLVAHLQASESHKKIERLYSALHNEKEAKAEIEEMMEARQNIFDVYSFRYESKFRYMHEVMQILRQQYHGALPITSLENYLNNIEDLSRKTKAVNQTLDEIEDLRSELITKHSVYDQILDINKNKCLEDENSCSHNLKNIVTVKMHEREKDHNLKKFNVLELSREQLTNHCNYLEKTLVLVNQGFEKSNFDGVLEKNKLIHNGSQNLKIEDIISDDEQSSHNSRTITLLKPQILKSSKTVNPNFTNKSEDEIVVLPSPAKTNVIKATATVVVQTEKKCKLVQTEEDQELLKLNQTNNKLNSDFERVNNELAEVLVLIQKHNNEISVLKKEKKGLESTIDKIKETEFRRDGIIQRLNTENDELRMQINEIINNYQDEKVKETNEEKESVIKALKQLENDKNAIVNDYKQLLKDEREEYSKTVKDLQVKLMEIQTQMDRKGSNGNSNNTEALKEVVGKYSIKITELEDHCFKIQSELDNCKTELTTYQGEADRWKELAMERLSKMEQLKYQLEDRHKTEMESYKAENQHWLSQLGDSQKSHVELRNRFTEQKNLHIKQMAEKDSQIEQLRTIIFNLKTQIINMQTMISVNDPSFDLSAIVEVEESNDVTSNCDKLEIRYDSSTDVNEHDELMRIPSSSTAIWLEPSIERCRREKQLALKQNAILRRQIKALASRERRARLDAQNLKSQVFRISTSGRTPTTAETAALHSKVASLQDQLTSARRETHSGLALWDKWKRAQQSSDRWQARYEDRCQEIKKLEASLHHSKLAITRLEREKRVLLTRQNEPKDKKSISLEKQEEEPSEKDQYEVSCGCSESPVSTRALLDRVEAQQRRIVALETAEKGNELLVSEYERSLAKITALKGQVLKLESNLLESQIRLPLKSNDDIPPELEYWKNYCNMLKEENMQLTMKVSSLETTPISANQHRVNDLEQTVLRLRGIVSKFQAEQKSAGVVVRKVDSRPSSGRSSSEKGRNNQETYRTEVVNLKRSIQDKDILLERSKEMLKIAAEREDELLRENAYLRRKLEELSRNKRGFLSA